LGRTADEVVHLRLERLVIGVVPRLDGLVLPVDEHGARVPVVLLPPEVVPPFEDEDLLARFGERMRERPAARPAADDDDVVVVSHGAYLTSGSDRGRGRGRSRPASA